MNRFEARATIARSAMDVWAYATDILRHPDWMNVADARVLRGRGTDIGARGRERLALGPFRWDVEFEVTEAEPGRRIAWQARDPRFDLEVKLELDPVDAASTRATYQAMIQMRGPWRVLAALVVMEGSAGVRRELSRLKAKVEAVPAMTPALS